MTISTYSVSREIRGFLGGAGQRAPLFAAFLVLALGGRIRDHAAAGLDINLAILEDGGPERDAGVHLAVGAEIADAAGVDAAPLRFELLDDLHRPDLGRARDGAGGKAGEQGVDGVELGVDLALDVGGD